MEYVVIYALGLVCGFVGGCGYCLIRARQADAKLTDGLKGSLERVGEMSRMLEECKREMDKAKRG